MPKLSITVSSDGMEAFIAPAAELREAGDITLEDVTKLLKQDGIAYGIDEEAIKTFVSAVEGALILARVYESKDPILNVAEQFQSTTRKTK